MEELDASLGLDLSLNIGFDTDFQTLLESSNKTTSLSSQPLQDSSASASPACSKCSILREQIARLERDHRINFQFLKKKVISTDLLIKRCKAKQDEVDAQAQTVLSLKRQLDSANRDASILSDQLKSAMENMKPLKQDKAVLESTLREKSSEIVFLTDRLCAEEALRHQRTCVTQHNQELEAEKLELEKKLKYLQTRNKSLHSNVSTLESDKKSLNMQKSIDSKRLNKLALLLDSAQTKLNMLWEQLTEAGVANETIKPKLIPRAVKFLITEALKSKASSNKKYLDSENVSLGKSGSKGHGDSDLDNGYDEEDGESDFDDVSDMEVFNESPEINSKNTSKKTIESGSNKSQASCDEQKLNGMSKPSKKKFEKPGFKDNEGTSLAKSNLNKKSTPQKRATADVDVTKKLLSSQKKCLNNVKLKDGLPDDISDSSDDEDLNEIKGKAPNAASSKISPAKTGLSRKLEKHASFSSESKNSMTNKSTPGSNVLSNGNRKLKEICAHTDNTGKQAKVRSKSAQDLSKKTKELIKADSSSDESSLCSLHSDHETWLSDQDAGQPVASKDVQEQQRVVKTNIKEKNDKGKITPRNKPNHEPQLLPPLSSSSSSSSSSENDEACDEMASRGLQGRQISREDDTVADDEMSKEGVSLDDIFSFMGNPLLLSPMPPTPRPRSRTVSEASCLDDNEDLSAPLDSESLHKAGPDPDSQSSNNLDVHNVEESDTVGTSDCSNRQNGVSETQGNQGTKAILNKDAKAIETVSGDPNKSSSILDGSKSPPGDVAVACQQKKRVDAGADLEMCGTDTDANSTDVTKNQESKISHSPHVFRQIRTMMSMGFAPSDDVMNGHMCIPGESNKPNLLETCQNEANEETQDQSKSASLVNLDGIPVAESETCEIQERLDQSVDADKKSKDPLDHVSISSPSSQERGLSSNEHTWNHNQASGLGSSAAQPSEVGKLHCGVEDANISSNTVLEHSQPLIELYVVKSPPTFRVERQQKLPTQLPEPQRDSLVNEKACNADEGGNGTSKSPMSTPPQRIRRRSSRLSIASEICEQELPTNDKVKNLETPEQRKQFVKSPIHSLSTSNFPDKNVAKTSGKLESTLSDSIIEQKKRSAMKHSMRTRSTSNPENKRATGIVSLAQRRARRSTSRLTIETDKLKPEEKIPTGQSFTNENLCSSPEASAQLSLEKTSNGQNLAFSKGKGHLSKARIQNKEITALSTNHSELPDSSMIKFDEIYSEEKDGAACIQFGPVSSRASLTSSPKHEPEPGASAGNQTQVDLLKLNGEKIKIDSQETLNVNDNQVKSRKGHIWSRQTNLSQISQAKDSTPEEKIAEIDTNHKSEVGTEKDKKRETTTATSQQRQLSVLTRKTQMEIAAQQLARMLMAAKSSNMKKSEAGQKRHTGNDNHTTIKRGRGKPRKVPQQNDKAATEVWSSNLNSKPVEGKQDVKQGSQTSVVTGDKVYTDSDLDTSSLSSDSDDTLKNNNPKRKSNLRVTRQIQRKKKEVNKVCHKGTALQEANSCKQLQQKEVPSIQGQVLPTLSSSESEDESHKKISRTNSKLLSNIAGPKMTKDLDKCLTRCSTVSTLSNSDSEGENANAEIENTFKESVENEQEKVKKSFKEAVQEHPSVTSARPRKVRGDGKLTIDGEKKLLGAKTTSIRVDHGNTATGDSRSNQKRIVVLDSINDEDDCNVTEKESASRPKKRKSRSSDGKPDSVKPGHSCIPQESRIKSKEFISCSSDDSDDNQKEVVKISRNENHLESGESSEKSSVDSGQPNLCQPSEVGEVKENGTGIKRFSNMGGSKSKEVKMFPHLLSSFVPSQFSAFQVAKSPKDVDKGFHLSEVENQPANIKHSCDSLQNGNYITDSKNVVLFGKNKGPPVVRAADSQNDERTVEQETPIPMEGKKKQSTISSDVSSFCNDEQTETMFTYNEVLHVEEEGADKLLKVLDSEDFSGDGVEKLHVAADTTKEVLSDKSKGSMNKGMKEKEGVDEPQSKQQFHSASSETKPLSSTLGMPLNPRDVVADFDDSCLLPLKINNTDVELNQNGQVYDKTNRKRKMPLETQDQVVPSILEPEVTRTDSNPGAVTLEEIFSLFQVPQCLSPLPCSPSQKKFCRDDEPCSHSTEKLVQFSAAVPDECVMVTPAATRLHHKRKSGCSSSHQGGPYTNNTEGSETRCESYGKITDSRDAALPVKPVGSVQSKPVETTNLSLSHQMVQARKLLMARRRGFNKDKQITDPVPSTKKQKKEQKDEAGSGQVKKKVAAKLGRFITPYAAILHDFKEFASKGGDISAMGDQVLTRVIDREVKSVLALLPQLVIECMDSLDVEDILSQIHTACDKPGDIIETVFASFAEIRVAKLISHLTTRAKDFDNSPIISAIWNEVFKKQKACEQTVVLSFCRLFTLLCVESGDVEQARVLAYSVAWCGYLPLWPCLATIMGVWPLVFSPSPLSSKKPILSVLACLLRSKYQQDLQNFRKVCQVTQRLCCWDVEEKEEDATQVLKSLKDRLASLTDNAADHSVADKMFATQKAMELLLVCQGEEWANKHFFQSILVSVAMRWEFSGGEATGPCAALVISLFKVFRSVLTVLPLTVTAAKQIVGQGLSRCLSMKNSQVEVDLVLLEALLDISAYNPQRCSELLRTWQNANPGKLTPHIFSKMQETRTLLASLLKDENNEEEAGSNNETNTSSLQKNKFHENSGLRGRQRGGYGRGKGQKKGFRGRGKK